MRLVHVSVFVFAWVGVFMFLCVSVFVCKHSCLAAGNMASYSTPE